MAGLAELADVENRLGRPIPDGDIQRAAGLIEEVQALALIEYPAMQSVVDSTAPAPLHLRVAVSRVVADAMTGRTDGVASEGIGPFTRSYTPSEPAQFDSLPDSVRRALCRVLGLPAPSRAANMSYY